MAPFISCVMPNGPHFSNFCHVNLIFAYMSPSNLLEVSWLVGHCYIII